MRTFASAARILLGIALLCAERTALAETSMLLDDLVASETTTSLETEQIEPLEAFDETTDFRDPLWAVTADAVFLRRQTPNSLVLMLNPFDPTQNLNANDFSFDFQSTWDVSLQRRLDATRAVELRYFGVESWTAAASAVTNVADPLRINTTPPTFLVTGRMITATYGSDLHNGEINLRQDVNEFLTLLAGFRYVEFDEDFRASLADPITPAPTVLYTTLTRNRLYGFQIGGDCCIWNRDAFSVDALCKAGVYANAAGHGTVLDTTVIAVPVRGETSHTAFLGEIQLSAVYDLTSCLSLRGGYGITWMSGVATATDQVPVTNFDTMSGIDTGGDVYYHGGFVGLQLVR